MAKKKGNETSGGQTAVLVIIICLLVIALAYMIGRDYIASMFKGEEGSAPIFRPLAVIRIINRLWKKSWTITM